ncbi:MAG: glycine zipper domain-containing protein [Nitrospirota bacterium]
MKRMIVILTLIAFTVTSIGCASLQNMSGEEKGAGIGAVLGGLTGAMLAGGGTKSKVLGGLLGAAVGAGVGYWVGKHLDKKVQSREEAVQQYQQTGALNNQKNTVFAMEDSQLDKPVAKPGEEAVSGVQYTVIEKNPTSMVTLVEKRFIEIDGDKFPIDTRTVTREQGTHVSAVKFTVPKDAGEYRVITIVEKEGKTLQAEERMKVEA